ncbi:MAG: hypothetical protein ACXWP4_14810 [Polyangiales bacterium]
MVSIRAFPFQINASRRCPHTVAHGVRTSPLRLRQKSVSNSLLRRTSGRPDQVVPAETAAACSRAKTAHRAGHGRREARLLPSPEIRRSAKHPSWCAFRSSQCEEGLRGAQRRLLEQQAQTGVLTYGGDAGRVCLRVEAVMFDRSLRRPSLPSRPFRRPRRARARRSVSPDPPPPGYSNRSGTYRRTLAVQDDGRVSGRETDAVLEFQSSEAIRSEGVVALEERTMGELFPRALIESVRPQFLVEFLSPFHTYCESRGLALDAVRADSPEWLDELYRFFNVPDRRRPVALRAAVEAIVHLSDDEGQEDVHGAIADLGASPPEHLTVTELAFWMYERHPHAFEDACRQKQRSAKQRYREFLPLDRRPLLDASSTEARMDLLHKLSKRHGALGHSHYADVRITEDDDEVRIFWIHGRGMQSLGVIRSDDEREVQRLVRDRCDLTFVDRLSGRLSVSALNQDQVFFLKNALGEVFFQNAKHFQRAEIYTGAPLLERGKRSLSVDGIEGLRRIELRAATLYQPDRGRTTYESRRCLFDTHADEMALARATTDAFVLKMKLAILYGADAHERTIEIAMPNALQFDRSIAERSLRHFLVTRGFANYGDGHGDWRLAA